MSYTRYSGLIDCKEDESVYVYQNEMFDRDGKIDKSMLGIVESIEQTEHPDWLGLDYITYSVVIRLEDGKRIEIKDDYTQPSRKYEFITLKDLKENHNVSSR